MAKIYLMQVRVQITPVDIKNQLQKLYNLQVNNTSLKQCKLTLQYTFTFETSILSFKECQ